MKTAYKVILVNFCTLVGCGIVALILPGDTPFIPFVIICSFTLVVMNCAFWSHYRRTRIPEKRSSGWTAAKLIAVWILFLVTLFISWRLRR